jgi:hypothetical protein
MIRLKTKIVHFGKYKRNFILKGNCLGLGKLDHRASLLEGGKKEKRQRSRRFSFFPPVLSRFSVVELAETRTGK